MSESITSFLGNNRFLSNFYQAEVKYQGMAYPTAEHAFQATKTDLSEEKLKIRTAKTPGEAKRLGRRCAIRADWDLIKDRVMEEILRSKFSDNVLRGMLVATGDAVLVEGNNWGDRYWGAVLQGGRFVGKNRLGEILMKIRSEFAKDHTSLKR